MTARISPAEYRRLVKAGRQKVHTAPQVYGGRTYRTKGEARYAEHLDLLKKAGQVTHWQPQVRFPLRAVSGVIVGHYVADFVVTFAEGIRQVHELKGWPTDVWIWKRRHFAADYPQLPLVVVEPKTLLPMSEDEIRKQYYATRGRAKAKRPGR